MATIAVFVKLKGADFDKAIAATNAAEEGAYLVIRDSEQVIARFILERIEHWYSEPLQS